MEIYKLVTMIIMLNLIMSAIGVWATPESEYLTGVQDQNALAQNLAEKIGGTWTEEDGFTNPQSSTVQEIGSGGISAILAIASLLGVVTSMFKGLMTTYGMLWSGINAGGIIGVIFWALSLGYVLFLIYTSIKVFNWFTKKDIN